MTEKEKFDIILSKNRIAREVKSLYKKVGMQAPEYIKLDFDEIEKRIGTLNQPTGREIIESDMDI